MESNQANAQFNIVPFQRVDISIGGSVDRSNGEYFAQYEGYGFYVERSDYPCLIHAVSQSATPGQAALCRDGLEVTAPFKGFTLSHPIINVPATLTLILFKAPCINQTNNLADPVQRLQISPRVITNTAVAQQQNIYVPPQSRILKKLSVRIPATTVDNVRLEPWNLNSGICIAPTSIVQQLTTGPVTYNGGNTNVLYAVPQAAGSGFLIAEFRDMVLPSSCVELALVITGTGLGVVTAMSGHFS